MVTTYSVPVPDSARVWLNVAQSFAQDQGYTFTTDCLTDLEHFLGDATVKLPASVITESAESHKDDVRRLVQYMIDEVKGVSPTDRELHEWSLSQARLRFCPLFPFC
jgi:hypothetical protein